MSLKNINGWMIPDTDRVISKKITKFGVIDGDVFYEKKSRDFLIKKIKKKDVFVDVGANIGIWTRVLSQEEINNVMWKNYAGLNTQEKQDLAAWYNLDSEVGSDGNAGSGYVLDEHSGAGSTTNLGTLEA